MNSKVIKNVFKNQKSSPKSCMKCPYDSYIHPYNHTKFIYWTGKCTSYDAANRLPLFHLATVALTRVLFIAYMHVLLAGYGK